MTNMTKVESKVDIQKQYSRKGYTKEGIHIGTGILIVKM